MGIVLLPSLSKAIKKNKKEEIETIQNRSLEFCLLISLPSAVGLYILANPIINILFERGEFLSIDTFYTSKVLSIFALGLPAYILIKVLVTCYFAREDTKSPLYISIVSVAANIILSILLIQSMREMGIAAATAISAWINALLLYIFLSFRNNLKLDSQLINNSLKIIIASGVMGYVCYYLNKILLLNVNDISILSKIGLLILILTFCKIIYIGLIFVLKVITIQDLKGYINK